MDALRFVNLCCERNWSSEEFLSHRHPALIHVYICHPVTNNETRAPDEISRLMKLPMSPSTYSAFDAPVVTFVVDLALSVV